MQYSISESGSIRFVPLAQLGVWPLVAPSSHASTVLRKKIG